MMITKETVMIMILEIWWETSVSKLLTMIMLSVCDVLQYP